MNACCLLLLPLLPQDPAPPPAPAPAALDVVALKNGDELVGRILTEIDGYVEVQLDAGAVVGLATSSVASIRRGERPAPAGGAAVSPRGEWFVLHDAAGNAVGWLSSAVSPRAGGGFAVNEEYEFQDGPRRYQVTSLATAAADGTARSAYFRERVSEPLFATLRVPGTESGAQTERIVDERIVEAVCDGGQLFVQRLDRDGRRYRVLHWPAGASFPLLARTLARSEVVGSRTMFDPAGEEMVVRTYAGGRRRSVVIDGERLQVTELAETTATGRNSEWIDAALRTVRREIAGPALVAVPTNADSAPFAVGASTIGSALVPEAGGTFGLWLPNPAWTVRDGQPAGHVALVCEPHGATATLSRLDHLEAGTPLDSAADAVAKWFTLLQPELRLTTREPVSVRDRSAVRLVAIGGGPRAPMQATIHVIPQGGHFLVLVCLASAAAWEELEPDFEFVQRSVELDAESLSPTLQGPLAERAKAEQRKNARRGSPPPAAAPAATAPKAPADKRPNVRIPADG